VSLRRRLTLTSLVASMVVVALASIASGPMFALSVGAARWTFIALGAILFGFILVAAHAPAFGKSDEQNSFLTWMPTFYLAGLSCAFVMMIVACLVSLERTRSIALFTVFGVGMLLLATRTWAKNFDKWLRSQTGADSSNRD
jgi:hypothetical protein